MFPYQFDFLGFHVLQKAEKVRERGEREIYMAKMKSRFFFVLHNSKQISKKMFVYFHTDVVYGEPR